VPSSVDAARLHAKASLRIRWSEWLVEVVCRGFRMFIAWTTLQAVSVVFCSYQTHVQPNNHMKFESYAPGPDIGGLDASGLLGRLGCGSIWSIADLASCHASMFCLHHSRC